MKKLFYLLSSAALLFGAASCDKGDVEEDIVPEVKKTSIVLNATIADNSRTTLDGLKVDWAEGDYIYLVTSDETWGQPYVSSSNTNITTIASYQYTNGAFADASSTELPALTEGQEYTVHAMYARTDQKSFHRGAASTHRLQATQLQDCSDPTAHIATEDALVGKFNITGGTTNTVDVAMNHIYTMMEVDVKNTTGKEIEISKFEMEAANAALAGDFTVNYSNTAVAIDVTLKENTTGYDKITVNVTNGTVANNGTLPIYFVMAPLTDYSGDVTFTVTDSEGYTYTKTVAVEEISFEAGKYNKTGYTISEGVAPVDYSGTYVLLVEDESKYYALSSTNAVSSSRLDAVLYDYNGAENIVSSESNLVWTITKEGSTYYIENNGKYLTWQAENQAATSGVNYASVKTDKYPLIISAIDGGGVAIRSKNLDTRHLSLNGQYFAFYNSTNYVYQFTFVPATYVALPELTWGNETTAIAYDDTTEHTVTVTTDATSVSVAAYDDMEGTQVCSWLKVSYADGVLTYQATENTTDAVRNAYVIAATTNANGTKKYTLEISQGKKVVISSDSKTYTLTITADMLKKLDDTQSSTYNKYKGIQTFTAVATDSSTIDVQVYIEAVMPATAAGKTGTIQCQANKATIYNKTDLGVISAINCDISEGNGVVSMYQGATEAPTSDVGTAGGFFQIKSTTSGAEYLNSITITFQK